MKKALLLIFIIVLLLILRSLVASLASLLANSQSVTHLQENVVQEKKQNQFLKEQLHYVQTPSFIEHEARDKLGLVRSGEKVVLAPPPPQKKEEIVRSDEANWKKWLKLFL